MAELILHNYWRSGASYRVRIALALKRVAYRYAAVELRKGEQRSELYLGLQPQGLTPALDIGGEILIQSPAIIEWLEERFSDPALLPAGPVDRATVRAMAAVIGCDVHPFGNLRILQALKGDLGASQQQVDGWLARWMGEGFAALETLVARHGDGFCFGGQPGLADCYLIPQIYAANRFGVALDAYPRLRAVAERADALPAFAAAHPDRQPDADPA